MPPNDFSRGGACASAVRRVKGRGHFNVRFGQKRTSRRFHPMSALPPKVDMEYGRPYPEVIAYLSE